MITLSLMRRNDAPNFTKEDVSSVQVQSADSLKSEGYRGSPVRITSPQITYTAAFCGRCGTKLFWHRDDLGSFEFPNTLVNAGHSGPQTSWGKGFEADVGITVRALFCKGYLEIESLWQRLLTGPILGCDDVNEWVKKLTLTSGLPRYHKTFVDGEPY